MKDRTVILGLGIAFIILVFIGGVVMGDMLNEFFEPRCDETITLKDVIRTDKGFCHAIQLDIYNLETNTMDLTILTPLVRNNYLEECG